MNAKDILKAIHRTYPKEALVPEISINTLSRIETGASVPASTQADYRGEIHALKLALTYCRVAGVGDESTTARKNFPLMSLTCDFCHKTFRVVSVDD